MPQNQTQNDFGNSQSDSQNDFNKPIQSDFDFAKSIEQICLSPKENSANERGEA